MTNSLITLPVDAPLDEIIAVIARDGGIIISDFVTKEHLDELNAGAEIAFDLAAKEKLPSQFKEQGNDFKASNTDIAFGLLATMPKPTAKIIQHPLWNQIMAAFLDGESTSWSGDKLVTNKTSYILNVAMSFKVKSGANAQVLHRDQSIHNVDAKENSLYTTVMGCLVAGTDSLAENGATRVIPGSHLWPPTRAPKPEEAVPAAMRRGSALFWLGSTYHGAGPNVTEPGSPNEIRQLYGVFGCRDFIRQEENQFLAIPLETARTLPKDVLERIGWKKSAGGAGFLKGGDPIKLYPGMRDVFF